MAAQIILCLSLVFFVHSIDGSADGGFQQGDLSRFFAGRGPQFDLQRPGSVHGISVPSHVHSSGAPTVPRFSDAHASSFPRDSPFLADRRGFARSLGQTPVFQRGVGLEHLHGTGGDVRHSHVGHHGTAGPVISRGAGMTHTHRSGLTHSHAGGDVNHNHGPGSASPVFGGSSGFGSGFGHPLPLSTEFQHGVGLEHSHGPGLTHTHPGGDVRHSHAGEQTHRFSQLRAAEHFHGNRFTHDFSPVSNQLSGGRFGFHSHHQSTHPQHVHQAAHAGHAHQPGHAGHAHQPGHVGHGHQPGHVHTM